MKKRKKNQIICSKKFKGGTRRKPIGFAIKPRLIQAKQATIYYSYNRLLPSVNASVSFLKAKVLKKGHFIFKIKQFAFYLSFKMRRRLNFFFRKLSFA